MTFALYKNIGVAGAIMLSAISGGHAGGIEETEVSFSKDIAPVMRRKCATCHLTGTEAGGMALHPRAAWKSIVGKPSGESPFFIVAPGEPEKSYLLMKLEGSHIENGGTGARMPFAAPPLNAGIIQTIRDWISAGAPDN